MLLRLLGYAVRLLGHSGRTVAIGKALHKLLRGAGGRTEFAVFDLLEVLFLGVVDLGLALSRKLLWLLFCGRSCSWCDEACCHGGGGQANGARGHRVNLPVTTGGDGADLVRVGGIGTI